jgi:uncharacterized cupin superfamily protein
MTLVHWDDVEAETDGIGPMQGRWYDLGTAAGTRSAGVMRQVADPGCQVSPVHRHGAEEELFYVLGGSGFSWQDGRAYAIAAGDVLLYRAAGPAHTVVGGDDGIDVLAFGPRIDVEATHLPRAGLLRIQQTWARAGEGEHPWDQEAEHGPVELREPSPRPATIRALDDIPGERKQRGRTDVVRRNVGDALGSVTTGMRHIEIAAGAESYPHHSHSAEEEIFVVLEGDGALALGDDEHAVRAGHVVSRPAGTGVAHSFVADARGIRDPNDMCWYPRSGKLRIRAFDLNFRPEPLDYWDGEE